MSIEPDYLRQALQLFGVKPPEGQDTAALAKTLDVIEEVLPWIVLKADGFDQEGEIAKALRAAAGRSARAATSRSTAQRPSLALKHASRELDHAVEALIRGDIAHQALATTADARLAELVRLSAAPPLSQPQNHIPVDPPPAAFPPQAGD